MFDNFKEAFREGKSSRKGGERHRGGGTLVRRRESDGGVDEGKKKKDGRNRFRRLKSEGNSGPEGDNEGED